MLCLLARRKCFLAVHAVFLRRASLTPDLRWKSSECSDAFNNEHKGAQSVNVPQNRSQMIRTFFFSAGNVCSGVCARVAESRPRLAGERDTEQILTR